MLWKVIQNTMLFFMTQSDALNKVLFNLKDVIQIKN